MIDESAIRLRFEVLAPVLDEQGRRRFAAAEAMAAGPGGVSAVMRATGIARSTIRRGLDELGDGDAPDAERVRRAGGEQFRKTITLRPNCRSTRSRIVNSTRAPASAKRAVVRGEYHRDFAKRSARPERGALGLPIVLPERPLHGLCFLDGTVEG